MTSNDLVVRFEVDPAIVMFAKDIDTYIDGELMMFREAAKQEFARRGLMEGDVRFEVWTGRETLFFTERLSVDVDTILSMRRPPPDSFPKGSKAGL